MRWAALALAGFLASSRYFPLRSMKISGAPRVWSNRVGAPVSAPALLLRRVEAPGHQKSQGQWHVAEKRPCTIPNLIFRMSSGTAA
jgi:hypothetical protein